MTAHQVSAPYNRALLTFLLKVMALILADGYFEFMMFFNFRDSSLALPIRAFTSASDPLYLSMMSWYVKLSTPSRASPSTVIGLVLALFHFLPTAADITATLSVFAFICCRVWDKTSDD